MPYPGFAFDFKSIDGSRRKVGKGGAQPGSRDEATGEATGTINTVNIDPLLSGGTLGTPAPENSAWL